MPRKKSLKDSLDSLFHRKKSTTTPSTDTTSPTTAPPTTVPAADTNASAVAPPSTPPPAPATGDYEVKEGQMDDEKYREAVRAKAHSNQYFNKIDEKIDLDELMDRIVDFCWGVSRAVYGAQNALMRDRVLYDNSEFIRATLWYMVKMYAMMLAAMIIFFPITIPLLFITPGSFISAMYYVPMLALREVKEDHKTQVFDMFVEGMHTRDEELARALAIQIKKHPEMVEKEIFSKVETLRRRRYFAMRAAFCSATGFIPMIGWIVAPTLSMLLISRNYGWELLKPYMFHCLNMDYGEQKEWMVKHRFVLMGYSIAYVSVAAIPFVGALVVAISQAGAPFLLDNDMIAKGHERYVPGSTYKPQDPVLYDLNGMKAGAKRVAEVARDKRTAEERKAALDAAKLAADDPAPAVAGTPQAAPVPQPVPQATA